MEILETIIKWLGITLLILTILFPPPEDETQPEPPKKQGQRMYRTQG